MPIRRTHSLTNNVSTKKRKKTNKKRVNFKNLIECPPGYTDANTKASNPMAFVNADFLKFPMGKEMQQRTGLPVKKQPCNESEYLTYKNNKWCCSENPQPRPQLKSDPEIQELLNKPQVAPDLKKYRTSNRKLAGLPPRVTLKERMDEHLRLQEIKNQMTEIHQGIKEKIKEYTLERSGILYKIKNIDESIQNNKGYVYDTNPTSIFTYIHNSKLILEENEYKILKEQLESVDKLLYSFYKKENEVVLELEAIELSSIGIK